MPEGFSRRTNEERDIQPVAIQSVNLEKREALVLTRIKTAINVDCSFATGDSTVTPAVGEQWYIERFDARWRLYGRIPFNDPTLLYEAVEGQVSVGSGRGPVLLHGQEGGVQVKGDLVLGEDHYRSVDNHLEKKTPDGSWVPVIPSSGSIIIATDISDSTALGRSVLKAADAPTARTALGAGTYSKPVDGIPSGDLSAAVVASLSLANSALQNVGASNIFDATSLGRQLLTAPDAAAARYVLNVGTGVSVASTDIVDSTTVGRAVLTATDQAAARAAIGAATTSADITDSTATGRALLTAASPTAARAAISAYTKPSDGIPLADMAVGNVAGSNNGTPTSLTLWVGTLSQYNAIVTKSGSTVYAVIE